MANFNPYPSPYTDRRYGGALSATQGFVNSFMQHLQFQRQMRSQLKDEQYRQSMMDITKSRLGMEQKRLGLAERQVALKEGTGGLTGMAGWLYKNEPKLFGQYARRQATGKSTIALELPSLQKKTLSDIEEDIVAGEKWLATTQDWEDRADPKFFEYGGALQARAERVGEKAGVLAPEDTKFLGRRTAFLGDVMEQFTIWRKWATGVAFGEYEAKEYEKVRPHQSDSYTEFLAKKRRIDQMTGHILDYLNEKRKSGMGGGRLFQGGGDDLDLSDIPTEDIIRELGFE